MRPRNLLRRIVWTANAIRHRDPLSPRLFLRLFGSWRRRPWDPAKAPRRVVILRSDEIGDTATTLALLAAMRLQWPKTVIHLVVKPGPAAMFHAASTVDRVIEWTPITEGSAPKRQILTARQALRRFRLRGYDLAVLPRWDFDDTPVRYLAAASRARSIVGFAPVPEREPVWFGDQSQLLTDEIERGDTPLLTVGQLRRVAQRLGLDWPTAQNPSIGHELFDDRDAKRVAEMAPLPSAPGLIVAVGIGARDAKRQWPVEDVSEAMGALAEAGPVTVQILGGAVDAQRAERLAQLLRQRGIAALDLAGGLTLSESAAAIARSDLFLGNDSGLQHIASAIDLPIVVVTCHPASGSPWSDNAPERFGPWSARNVVLQPATPSPYCTEECVAGEPHCIRQVRAADAVTAITGLLQGAAS